MERDITKNENKSWFLCQLLEIHENFILELDILVAMIIGYEEGFPGSAADRLVPFTIFRLHSGQPTH